MKRIGLREYIKWQISTNEGIKASTLLALCATEFIEIQMLDIKQELLDMIQDKEFIEIEYILNGKSKSFFLPVGTEIRIVR